VVVIDGAADLANKRGLNYHLERMSKNGKALARDLSVKPTKRRRRVVGVPDVEIRPALREHLLRCHASETDTVLIEELGLHRGRVRVDIAVVNGSLHGFEIKSDRDSLRRLATQVNLYSQVLDRATLVVGERFAPLATSLVPAWWGVIRVSSKPAGLRFTALRRSRLNPQRNPRMIAELLWSEQALALLEAHGAARGVRGKPRRILWDRVCECLSVDEIAAAVRGRLKANSDSEVPARPL
jgi:hypothetical protein